MPRLIFRRSVIVLCFVLICLPTSQAGAAGIGLTVYTTAGAGLISYDGNGGPLRGTGLAVDSLFAAGIQQLLTIIDGVAAFETGPFDSINASCGGGPCWIWGEGTTDGLSVIGGVDVNRDGDANDAEDIPAGTVLVTGTVSRGLDGRLTYAQYQGGSAWQSIGFTSKMTVNPLLVPLIFGPGVPPTASTGVGIINLDWAGPNDQLGSAFSVQPKHFLVSYTPLPEPGPFLLLICGLIGVVARRAILDRLPPQ
jgi:hypothetical protein